MMLGWEDKERIHETLRYLEDCMRFADAMKKLPTCNDCGDRGSCSYRPAWGDPVRYNCPLWIKDGETT